MFYKHCIAVSFFTLMIIVNTHTTPLDIGIARKPATVTYCVTEVDFFAKVSNISDDCNIVLTILYFLYFFSSFIFCFISKLAYHFFDTFNRNTETIRNICFFSKLPSVAATGSNGAEGYMSFSIGLYIS